MMEGNDVKGIRALIDEYDLSFAEGEEADAIRAIPAILTISRNQAYHIDFDDMIWIHLWRTIRFQLLI